MADHSHLFFFKNLSPNPKPSHGRPLKAHLHRSNNTSDGSSQSQMVVLNLEPPSHRNLYLNPILT